MASKYVARAAAPSTVLESWRYACNRHEGVRHQWGSPTYSVSHVLNAAGQRAKTSTRRSFPAASADAVSWPAAPGVTDNPVREYAPSSRLPLSKADPRQTVAGKKATCGYWPGVNPLIGSIPFGEAAGGGSTLRPAQLTMRSDA